MLVYDASKYFPTDERFGLTSQVRRACVSVPSNIAEGAGKKSKKEFTNFISIATGSIFETETQIIIAQRLNYIKETENIFKLIEEIQKMLYGFAIKLEE